MSSPRLSGMRRLLPGMLPILALVSAASLWKLAADNDYLGKGDFLAYWSAARLLRDGRNPYDPAAIMTAERELTRSSFDEPITASNPPTLFILILPLTWLSFSAAKATWLVLNLAMLLAATYLLMQIYAPYSKKTLLALGLYWALFPQILVGLLAGQVISLVLLGLTGSMLFVRHGRWFWAGASLIVTTVKPHMAVLAVPYLLLYMAHRRKWQGWLGLLAAGAVCAVILSALRPSWPQDFLGLNPFAEVRLWATPTVGGLMSLLRLGELGRYVFAAFLPLAWVLARMQSGVTPEAAVSLLTVITVPTTIFGWSYDQSVLLIPLAEIVSWVLLQPINAAKTVVSAALLVLLVADWLQRIRVTGEVYYAWIPIAVAVLYCLFRVANRKPQLKSTSNNVQARSET